MTDQPRPQSGRLPPPKHLSPNPPVPEPAEPVVTEEQSPTRYGDWERNGIAIDF
ncbi:hypothetical protein FHS31_001061 [Sphingomonas vulcanisoli]|uniref:DUF1674 domain-containing protein n=1 Tax=Sphingomonas vulcanisoli TaxID=1658060 RepID=A0ABX0TUL7_9SPHN|nr:DUF1674 domain-containing protein [Sphingomonas vulcanisoli]NIJ07465.1 hypothetical protein [Sphingomonas vulcanisoli]